METGKKRRSSILKPQKPRNPSSELEVTNENTASRLLTKRVSFGSNFIKEFAADGGKNTIWNVTYEEILSNSTRSSENAQNTLANQHSQATVCPNNVDSENKQMDVDNLSTNKPQESTTIEPSKPIQNALQLNLPENKVAIQSKCQNKTVIEDCDLEFTQLCMPNNRSVLNKTSADNSTMDFTAFINNFKPHMNSTTVHQDQEVKFKDVTLTETSMDITDIPLNNYRIIETKMAMPLINDKKSSYEGSSSELLNRECLGRRENLNITKIFRENMEITHNTANNAESNLKMIENIQRERNVEKEFNKTAMLGESMEFTRKAPELQNCKTVVDESMEFTRAVPLSTIQEHSNFLEMLSSVHQNTGQILVKENVENPLNKTTFFNDSMEFTQKVPLNHYNFECGDVRMKEKQLFQQSGTQNLVQNSSKNASSRVVQQEGVKTNLFNDNMEFTEKVHLKQYNFEGLQNVKMGLKQQSRIQNVKLHQKALQIAPRQRVQEEDLKTRLFNSSMEFTENVHFNLHDFEGLGANQQSGEIQKAGLFQKTLESAPSQIVQKEDVKPKFFNSNMQFTENVPLNLYNFEGLEHVKKEVNQQSGGSTQTADLFQKTFESAPSQIVQNEDVKTKFFNSNMEFTEIVPSNLYNFEGLENVKRELNQQSGGATQNAGLIQKTLESAPSQAIQMKDMKTNLFSSNMEFTENVPFNLHSFGVLENVKREINQQSGATQNAGLFQKTLESAPSQIVQKHNVKTKLFNSNMEFTENVPSNLYNFEGLENVKRGLNQQSDGATQNAGLIQKTLESASSQITQKEDVTKKLDNSNMEFTENVPFNLHSFGVLENVKREINQQSGATQNASLFQKTLESAPSRIVQKHDVKTKLSNSNMEFTENVPLNLYNFEGLENVKRGLNQQNDGATQNTGLILKKTLESASSQITQKEDVTKKLENSNMEFTENVSFNLYNFEGLKKRANQQSGATQNANLIQKTLDSPQKEDVISKRFNNSMELTGKVSLNQYNLERLENVTKELNQQSCGTEKSSLLQKTLETAASQIVQEEDRRPKIDQTYIVNDNIELVHRVSPNVDELINIPNEVPLNSESLQNALERDTNIVNATKNSNEVVKFTPNTRLMGSSSRLFESMEFPNEICSNTQSSFVQYQQKEGPKQNHNWTQTCSVSTEFIQEMSVNKEVAINSMQYLQMSQIKDISQNVSFPKLCDDSIELTQEPSQQSNKSFCSDYEILLKYEAGALLDEITPPLHNSLDPIDCSLTHIKIPIIQLTKIENPFRAKLKEFEDYLENQSVELEQSSIDHKELIEDLVRNMTLPKQVFNYETHKIDFDALQNYSYDDMDLTSDDSSDDSIFQLNSDLNENDEKALSIKEKIQNKNSSCDDYYYNIIDVESCKCKLDTLFSSIRLEVHFNYETGEVKLIEICDRLADTSKPCAFLAHKVFVDKLSPKNIRSAVGVHYDILTLMDYIYMNMQKILEFMGDLNKFEGHFGLKFDSNFRVKFNVVSITLRIVWWITVDLSDMENIVENSITAVATVGSLKDCNIKMFLNNCPRGITFLRSFINNILSHIELLETQRKKK